MAPSSRRVPTTFVPEAADVMSGSIEEAGFEPPVILSRVVNKEKRYHGQQPPCDPSFPPANQLLEPQLPLGNFVNVNAQPVLHQPIAGGQHNMHEFISKESSSMDS